ncbi:outer membrane protein assembly factor BamE [Sphingomonas sp. MAH-20]|uniref:Outer membrane protein assembly factor BamE n=1 Tax=Sphingomonas horti TaxID=2682842 RepID=A0A6I4IXM4_9SPHN|nr:MULTISPECIES: outer membrane protein assembly factor BamE [Sphingomonas]MBA2920954.1 outer membrane protein assembly factor BamE [Sphingomonas sp. CGMCC 1.13658]MVO76940.1 outer membrane protein assembly factor BamE [Sphingomonas horti]
MSSLTRRMITGAALAGAMVAASGCTRIVTHQGYLVDTQLVSTVQPGIDNKQSVQKVLGLPSFTGQFSDNDWYYVARTSKQLAFGSPKPTEQTVLHIRFDQAGNVAAVEQTGLERVARIDPVSDKTPTLGRKHGFFEDLFGNIGRVGTLPGGPAQSGNTGG